MRLLIALACMGLVGAVASALAFVQVLARTWPLLVIVVAIIAAVRWHDRHRRGVAPQRGLATPMCESPRQLIPGGPAVAPRPVGWVLVPVWMGPADRQALRHPVIDGDVITGDGRDG